MAVHWVFGIAIVEGRSMQPIYQKGDILLYQRRMSGTLDYGDVVVVHFNDQTNNSVKRIVGKPGDSIEIDEKGCLTRNGEAINETEVIFGDQEGDHPMSFRTVVPEGNYFCLGDNRPVSLDSRRLGTVGEKDIAGRVLLQFRVAWGDNYVDR